MTIKRSRSKKQIDSDFYGLEDLEREFGRLTFGEALRAYREGEEMTQVELANMLGLSRQNLCDLEKGRKIPSMKRAAEIGEALGYGSTMFVQLALQDQFAKKV